jgi:hypothetical protein
VQSRRLSPQLKRAVSDALGRCCDSAPPHLPERLLLAAVDANSPGLTAVLDELEIAVSALTQMLTRHLNIAS